MRGMLQLIAIIVTDQAVLRSVAPFFIVLSMWSVDRSVMGTAVCLPGKARSICAKFLLVIFVCVVCVKARTANLSNHDRI